MAPKDTAERLWLTEPRRKTCLAEVTRVHRRDFALDRSLFAPRSRSYRHPQPPDRGTVWIEGGEKRRLITVYEHKGEVWHRLRGTRPEVGQTLQCHLDQRRRAQVSRTHTAMHLLLAAAHHLKGPPLAADPEVKLGGHFRIEFQSHYVTPDDLAAWLQRANQYVQQDIEVAREFVPRDAAAKRLTPQHFAEGNAFPGPEATLQAVDMGAACSYPCDGTHVERTGDVGRVVIVEAHPGGSGEFVVVGRVVDGG